MLYCQKPLRPKPNQYLNTSEQKEEQTQNRIWIICSDLYILQSYFTNDLCQIPILISNFGVTILSYDTTRHGKNLKSYEVINFPSASLTCFLLRLLKKIGHWFLPEEEFIQWSVNTSFWWHISKKRKLPRADSANSILPYWWAVWNWSPDLFPQPLMFCEPMFFYKNSWTSNIYIVHITSYKVVEGCNKHCIHISKYMASWNYC